MSQGFLNQIGRHINKGKLSVQQFNCNNICFSLHSELLTMTQLNIQVHLFLHCSRRKVCNTNNRKYCYVPEVCADSSYYLKRRMTSNGKTPPSKTAKKGNIIPHLLTKEHRENYTASYHLLVSCQQPGNLLVCVRVSSTSAPAGGRHAPLFALTPHWCEKCSGKRGYIIYLNGK